MKKNRIPSQVAVMCLLAGIIMSTLSLGGCCSTSSKKVVRLDTDTILEMNRQAKISAEYKLTPGDLICIRFLYSPELNNDELIISPDGHINLHLIGAVKAAGLSLTELQQLLTEKYYHALGYRQGEYSLGVGDDISVKLLYTPELNSDVTIRPDRKISLPLIGEVVTAGMTPGQLETYLTEKYARMMKTQEGPSVTVFVRNFKIPEINVSLLASASQVAYIGGEVARPRMINITNPMKIINAITMAGGTTYNAKLKNVVLIRYNETDTADTYLLDVKQILSGKAPDLALRPYDIIFVPKTSIAKADQYMQHIWNVLPTNILFSFPYNLNPETEIDIKD